MNDLKLYGKGEKLVDILVQSVRVVSEDVEWNLEYKNVQSWSWRGGNLSSQRELSSQVKDCMIWAVNDGDVDSYKYLRVLEGDEIKHTRWKEELRRITFVKYREYLSLKWMVGIMVLEINCRVVAVVWFAAGMVEWTKILELQIVDRKMRNIYVILASAGWYRQALL